MSVTIVNLTEPVVAAQIERILDTYPHHPYQQAFSTPKLKQKLIAYVLSRVPNYYTTIEDDELPSANLAASISPWNFQLDIDTLIHQGIAHILDSTSEWTKRHIPEAVNAGYAASNWFG